MDMAFTQIRKEIDMNHKFMTTRKIQDIFFEESYMVKVKSSLKMAILILENLKMVNDLVKER